MTDVSVKRLPIAMRYFPLLKVLVLSLLLLVFSVSASGQRSRSPRIGLVLGGGGAKGAAHVGVLHVLEEMKVPVHCIVGTSIGAIVGGMYASGMRADELDSLFTHQDWLSLFAREMVQGGTIEALFKELLPENMPQSFDDLSIPFRCVAVDRVSMKQVVFDHGDMAQAMRASMAIPTVLRSVKLDSMKLIDGGVLNNLPVDVAREMGADIIIAVDLQQHQHDDKEEIDNPFLNVITKIPVVDWLLHRPDWKNYNANRKNADLIINPDLDGYKVSSFEQEKIIKMIDIGKKTAKRKKKDLKKIKNNKLKKR